VFFKTLDMKVSLAGVTAVGVRRTGDEVETLELRKPGKPDVAQVQDTTNQSQEKANNTEKKTTTNHRS